MKFYIEVHAPMDQVFVGPFETAEAAYQYAKGIQQKCSHHDCYVLTEGAKRASEQRYGQLPLIHPRAA